MNKKRKIRLFQGIPVREGRGDILVQPTKADIRSAVRNDPENCAYARCLQRMLETNKVFVYTTVCYVQTLDERGNPIMERYIVKDHAHAYIQKFDAGEEVGPGGFILHRPYRSKTLEYKRKQSVETYKKNPRRARELGQLSYKKAQARKVHAHTAPTDILPSTFRDGKGMVHFIGTEGILEVRKEII
jgi:hypothetical protein